VLLQTSALVGPLHIVAEVLFKSVGYRPTVKRKGERDTYPVRPYNFVVGSVFSQFGGVLAKGTYRARQNVLNITLKQRMFKLRAQIGPSEM
jgi:hypothetical protein